jgi:hypothetical protein
MLKNPPIDDYCGGRMASQTQPKTGRLTRKTIRKIIDEIDECDAYCLDHMYEVGRPLDPNLYGECIDKCFLEISKKYNVPIEKIYEIDRTLAIEPRLLNLIYGDGE